MQRLIPEYDLISCFYSLDLFFKNQKKTVSLFQFLDDYLINGGFFIGRLDDSSTLLQWFVDDNVVTKGTNKFIYRVSPDDSEFGKNYTHFQNEDKKIKYIANLDVLEKMGTERGLVFLGTYDLISIYKEYKNQNNKLSPSDEELSMLSKYFAFYKPIQPQ